MANHSKRGEPGRPCKGADALTRQIFARATDAQHVAYLAAGGADWLRTQLDAEITRQRLAPTPTAHNPFPTGPDRFTQNQCRMTFPPSNQE